MSDLISRSALLEEIKRELERGRAIDSFFDGTLFHYTGIKAIIENQPTAYDVDKVVKELEEESFWTEPTFDEDGYCNDDSWEAVYLDKAIEIVKEVGGMNAP